MTQWVIAEWADEGEERVRAPSYQSATGKWYRAGVSDYGGPTILLMDGDPVEDTRLLAATPSRELRFKWRHSWRTGSPGGRLLSGVGAYP
jgi:hypothetical protein